MDKFLNARKIFHKEDEFMAMLRDQAKKINETSKPFRELIKRPNNRSLERIGEIEHSADEIVKRMFSEINRTLITPVDDIDLMNLSVALDDVLDHIYNASRKIVAYRLKTTKEFKELTEILYEATARLEEILNKQKMESVKNTLETIHELESKGNDAFFRALEKIQCVKDCTRLVALRDVYGELEDAINRTQDAADIYLIILIKER
ncbi:MAG: DUF47 domain-containing protein [Candidatus Micrarchaeia archaeon]